MNLFRRTWWLYGFLALLAGPRLTPIATSALRTAYLDALVASGQHSVASLLKMRLRT